MFIELVDSLRCPRPHELTWLVAGAVRMEGRRIVEGLLGCPTCRAEYPIRGGVVDFTGGADAPAPSASPNEPVDAPAMRAAALLGLDAPGGYAVLAGAWGGVAGELLSMVEGTSLLLANA